MTEVIGPDHALYGIQVKIQRTEELIGGLKAEIDQFLFADPYHLIGGLNLDCTEYIFKQYGPLPPARFSVLTGEIIHHLRSCFDHLVVALVKENGGDFNQRQLSFPVAKKEEHFENAVESGRISCVSDSAAALIREVQPFNNATPDNHTLLAIHELDVWDKHRLLVVLGASSSTSALKMGTHDPEGKNIEIHSIYLPGMNQEALRNNEQVSVGLTKPVPDFYVDADFTFDIVFPKLGSSELVPLIPALSQMAKYTATIVHQFLPEFPASRRRIAYTVDPPL